MSDGKNLKKEQGEWMRDSAVNLGETECFLVTVSEALINALDRIHILEERLDSGPNNYDMPDVVDLTKAPYGYCPFCGAPGIGRERRMDGDDTCKNGHKYPSCNALKGPSFPLRAYSKKEISDIKREAMIRFGEWVIRNLYIEEDGKNDRLLSAVMGRLTQGGDL